MIEVGIDQLQLAHLESHRLHLRGELIDGGGGGAVSEAGPHRFPVGIPEQVAGAFQKLLALQSQIHNAVAMPAIPVAEKFDLIAPAAVQHA